MKSTFISIFILLTTNVLWSEEIDYMKKPPILKEKYKTSVNNRSKSYNHSIAYNARRYANETHGHIAIPSDELLVPQDNQAIHYKSD